MAEEGTLCVNADVVKKAGSGASSTYTAEAYTNEYIKLAEGFICAQSGYDWVTNVGSVSTQGLSFLKDLVASLAAMDVVGQDMTGYASKIEAQILLDLLWGKVVEGVNLLREQTYRKFILSGVWA